MRICLAIFKILSQNTGSSVKKFKNMYGIECLDSRRSLPSWRRGQEWRTTLRSLHRYRRGIFTLATHLWKPKIFCGSDHW